MTNGKNYWAPILTAKNQFGNNPIQRFLNNVYPVIPKIIWKLQKGDTNTRLRKGFQLKVNELSKEYILNNKQSHLFDFLNKNKIKEDLKCDNYKGEYNSIASILKFINNN